LPKRPQKCRLHHFLSALFLLSGINFPTKKTKFKKCKLKLFIQDLQNDSTSKSQKVVPSTQHKPLKTFEKSSVHGWIYLKSPLFIQSLLFGVSFASSCIIVTNFTSPIQKRSRITKFGSMLPLQGREGVILSLLQKERQVERPGQTFSQDRSSPPDAEETGRSNERKMQRAMSDSLGDMWEEYSAFLSRRTQLLSRAEDFFAGAQTVNMALKSFCKHVFLLCLNHENIVRNSVHFVQLFH